MEINTILVDQPIREMDWFCTSRSGARCFFHNSAAKTTSVFFVSCGEFCLVLPLCSVPLFWLKLVCSFSQKENSILRLFKSSQSVGAIRKNSRTRHKLMLLCDLNNNAEFVALQSEDDQEHGDGERGADGRGVEAPLREGERQELAAARHARALPG